MNVPPSTPPQNGVEADSDDEPAPAPTTTSTRNSGGGGKRKRTGEQGPAAKRVKGGFAVQELGDGSDDDKARKPKVCKGERVTVIE